jgi:hypothetical protein
MGIPAGNTGTRVEKQKLTFWVWYRVDMAQNSTIKPLQYLRPTRYAIVEEERDGLLCTDIGYGQRLYSLASHRFPSGTTFHLVGVDKAEILTQEAEKCRW